MNPAVDKPVRHAILVQRYYEELEYLEPEGRPRQMATRMADHGRRTTG